MRKSQQYLGIALIVMTVWSFVLPGTVWGVGTAAGTVIPNGGDTGTLGDTDQPEDLVGDFTSGSPITAAATISTVASAFDTLATPNYTTPKTGGTGTTVDFAYALQNGGNIADNFSFTTTMDETIATGAPTVALYVDANGNGIREAGETTPIANPLTLAANATSKFFVSVTIPGTAQDGESATIGLTIANQNGGGANDSWGSGLDTYADSAMVAQVSAVVMVIAITNNKPTGVKPDNPGVTGVPTATQDTGAVITYTITYQNTGSAAALNFRIRSKLPSVVVYIPGTITLNGSPVTDAADADGDFGSTVSNGVTVNVGTVSASATGSITYKVYVP